MKAFAFAAQNRLNERAGYTRVFAKPVYAKKTSLFSVFACRNTQPQARLGIVVARKNVKLAVARNKLKRMIRESFRQQQAHLSGLDIVVVVKKDFVADPCNDINTLKLFPGVFKAVGDRCAPCSSKE